MSSDSDSKAATYAGPEWQQAMVEQITAEMRSRLDWYGVPWVTNTTVPNPKSSTVPTADADSEGAREVKMLDYACGPGMASHAFLTHVTKIRGIDLSSGMVTEYNRRAKALALPVPEETMHAVRGNLFADVVEPDLDRPELYGFDFAIANAAFHHFEDPELATKRLVERLKSWNGVLMIVDFLPQEAGGGHGHGHGHGHRHGHGGVKDAEDFYSTSAHTIAHFGFEKGRVVKMFEDAGCVDVDVIVLKKPLKFGEGADAPEIKAFMGKGRRA
ncbi:MAG: hypothetical protein MMC33_007237 [Icmadophila ericetorum]|nr:hypothetical protein [Icmadophila ericetorum]